jgi:kinesin family protein 2/24
MNQMVIEEGTFQFLDNTPKIRVVVRKRPLNKRESQKNEVDIVECRGTQTVIVRETKTKVDLTKYIEEHNFNFDRGFDENTTNTQLYQEAVRPLVDALFNKAKVTCFAYGQTGSGKTFTMMGDPGGENKENQHPIPGLYLLAAQDIFNILETTPEFKNLGLYISFYEIYCGKLHDLLNERQQLHPREDAKGNVNIVGLSEKRVVNVHSLMQIIDFGNTVRTTGSTAANMDSSRSHAILQVSLKEGNKTFGKMSFIDLAGSERGADVVDTSKQTRMDGAEINKSLLALKECIRALDQDKKHTPFRGSKLTLVLKDSFTGNCKTVMIGNISPCAMSCEHTLNTLRYADRVKELKKPPGEINSNLSQLDLLAQQLMLPRQQKNATKMAVKNDQDGNSSSVSVAPALNNLLHQNNNNNNNHMNNNNHYNNQFNQLNHLASNNMGMAAEKGGRTRFSMPVFPNNQQQQPQPNLLSGLSGFPQQQQQQQQNNNNMGGQYQNFNNNNYQQQQYNQYNQMPQQFNQQQVPQPQPLKTSPLPLTFQKTPSYQGQNPLQPHPQESLFDLDNRAMNMNNANQFVNNVTPKQQNAQFQVNVPKVQNNVAPGGFFQAQNMGGFALNNNVNVNVNNAWNKENALNAGSGINSGAISPTHDFIQNFKAKSEEDLQILNQKHEQLINVILTEEEEVISSHRQHIDDMVDLIKQEMVLLHDVDRPASDIDEYVENLDAILAHKLEIITTLKSRLTRFREHLKEEELLSKKFYEQRNEVMDIFDLNANVDDGFKNEDMQLLDDLHKVMS